MYNGAACWSSKADLHGGAETLSIQALRVGILGGLTAVFQLDAQVRFRKAVLGTKF